MKKIKNIISYLIIIIAIIILIAFYNKYNFNNFVKSINTKNVTNFTRDNTIKYSQNDSYKIESTDYNDAMISQTVNVEKNTPYKVTCKVKTEDVQNKLENATGGVHICLEETQERSESITGTNDWQELAFMFNSKNNSEVNIGFRLGGYETLSKGTVWFSDFKLEKGITSDSNIWNMICFIFPNIDVDVNEKQEGKHVNIQMSQNDIATIQTNLSRFKTTIRDVSKDKIKINYETYIIEQPIKTLSYDKENGYYVSEKDVENYIKQYMDQKEYDHIYVAFRMADTKAGENVLVNDWIGLGGMEYNGIGFSNIRMPDDSRNLAYVFNYRINTFPEEVFLHEFLHTLERNAEEQGYEIPKLHDYEKYGYSENSTDGLKSWYSDYMNKQINYKGEMLGLPSEIYTIKPVHESNFKYGINVKAFKEPEGIIEIVQSIVSRVQKVFASKTK